MQIKDLKVGRIVAIGLLRLFRSWSVKVSASSMITL